MRIFIFLFLLFNVFLAFSQSKEFQITNKTIFRNEAGELISFEQFLELTSGEGYEMKPEFDESGNLKEIKILKSSVAPLQLQTNQFASPTELIGHAPPSFSGLDMSGQQYIYENLRGKVIVIKFWFIACPPCIQEMPQLNQLVADYQNQEVIFLGFALDDSEEIKQFLQQRNFNYQLIPSGRNVAHAYNVLGYPTHLVINKSGIVDAVYMGVNTRIREKLSRAIDSALMGTSDSNNVITNLEILPPDEEEVMVTPASIIKNEKGEILSFEVFASLMNTNRFTLLKRRDELGQEYILLREVK